jgi:polysaccharide export outer membrane protein
MKLKSITFRNNLVILSISIVIITFSSCIPQKKLRYLQTKTANDTINQFILKQYPKNTVQAYDNLYIKVISPDEQTSRMFNSEAQNVTQNVDYNMISYTVNDSGYISFPFVGLIKVKDLTILAAQDTVQAAISKFISEASVLVKFVGKSITIIGEVPRQGEYIIYSDNISIFKALSMAGGLTDYGNRENVTIIREDNGKAKMNTINIADKYILQSDFYFLRPDDVVVVQPLKQKSFGFAQFPYELVLASLTTLVTLLTFVRTFK